MEILENRLVARYFPVTYYLAMSKESFRDRVLAVLADKSMSKAELHRLSKVPYHAIDKLLKRPGASTSADNAQAIARVLGITVDDDATYDELRSLYYRLDKDQQAFLLQSIRGLLGS